MFFETINMENYAICNRDSLGFFFLIHVYVTLLSILMCCD